MVCLASFSHLRPQPLQAKIAPVCREDKQEREEMKSRQKQQSGGYCNTEAEAFGLGLGRSGWGEGRDGGRHEGPDLRDIDLTLVLLE